MRKLIIGGNWKMFKTATEAVTTSRALKMKLVNVAGVDMVICPPFIDLVPVHEILGGSNIKLGGQNMYWEDEGAFTGEISAKMLKDAGCEFVIIGHSERRHVFGESNADVNRKLQKALSSDLTPIFCVGEKLEQRNDGLTQQVLEEQIKEGLSDLEISKSEDLVIAYEPVWAIGTGVNATPEQAEEAHQFIRRMLEELLGDVANQIRIQYGGSVKPATAEALLDQDNIDGTLVGGASLDPGSFAAIIKAGQKISK